MRHVAGVGAASRAGVGGGRAVPDHDFRVDSRPEALSAASHELLCIRSASLIGASMHDMHAVQARSCQGHCQVDCMLTGLIV